MAVRNTMAMVPNGHTLRKQNDSSARVFEGMLPAMLFADAALASRIETAECGLSLAIMQAMVARGADAFSIPIGGGAAVFTGAGSPINKVIGVGFNGTPGEDVCGRPSSGSSPRSSALSVSSCLRWPSKESLPH